MARTPRNLRGDVVTLFVSSGVSERVRSVVFMADGVTIVRVWSASRNYTRVCFHLTRTYRDVHIKHYKPTTIRIPYGLWCSTPYKSYIRTVEDGQCVYIITIVTTCIIVIDAAIIKQAIIKQANAKT